MGGHRVGQDIQQHPGLPPLATSSTSSPGPSCDNQKCLCGGQNCPCWEPLPCANQEISFLGCSWLPRLPVPGLGTTWQSWPCISPQTTPSPSPRSSPRPSKRRSRAAGAAPARRFQTFPWTRVQVRGWEGAGETAGGRLKTDTKGRGGRGASVLFDGCDPWPAPPALREYFPGWEQAANLVF